MQESFADSTGPRNIHFLTPPIPAMLEITVSGLPRARRLELQALVERLRGAYSGALVVGRTAAVVVEGEVDWSAPKLAAAVANAIPVVSMDWILDSSINGFLLDPAPYTLSALSAERRSSAASTSALQCATNPAPSAAAPVSAANTTAPKAGAPAPTCSTQEAGASPPVSLEKLRGEQSGVALYSALAAMFIEPAEEVSPRQAQEILPKCELAFTPKRASESPSPPPVDDASAQDGSRELAPLACSPILLPSLDTGSPCNQQAVETSKENKRQLNCAFLTPGIDQASQGGSAMHSHVMADSNSDGQLACFLSLMPQVTLRRGRLTQHVQQQASCDSFRDVSPGNAGPGLLGSLQGVGSAERPGSSGSGAYSCRKIRRHALSDDSPGMQDATGAGTGSTSEPWRTPAGPEDVVDSATPQRDTGGRCSLPATTLIRLGPRLERPLPKAVLDQIAERHSLPGPPLGAGNLPGALTFHKSAVAMVQDGPQLEFVAGTYRDQPPSVAHPNPTASALAPQELHARAAGDTQHGALMLYDVLDGGQRVVLALALLQAIYRLGDEVRNRWGGRKSIGASSTVTSTL